MTTMESVELNDESKMAADAPVVVYRQFDDGYLVRSMNLAHQDAATVQNWFAFNLNYVTSKFDLEIALKSFPAALRGFYMGEYNGQVVASAIRLPWGEDICYGSYYFVEESVRGRGFGTRLRDQVAREHVGTRKLCVDAVLGKVTKDNEEKFGYRSAYKAARFSATAKETYTSPNTSARIKPISDVTFDALMAYDNKCFISRDFGPRRTFLSQWLYLPGGATYVALDDVTGDVVGYGSRQPAVQPANHGIGPLYADKPEIAEALLGALCSDVAGDNVVMHILYPQEKVHPLLTKFDFKRVFDMQRMHLNGSPSDELKEQVYAFTSVEVCGY